MAQDLDELLGDITNILDDSPAPSTKDQANGLSRGQEPPSTAQAVKKHLSDEPSVQNAAAAYLIPRSDDAVIAQALEILFGRLTKPDGYITSPESAAQYVQLKLTEYKHEVFGMLWLDNRHGVLGFEELFTGTIDGTSVPPRTTVQRALEVNAAAVIFAHNHPSGHCEPSQADQNITQRLRDALALVDVRVLDHLVIGGDEVVSFAERGLL